jgi:ATP-dependent RNA helicase MSS116
MLHRPVVPFQFADTTHRLAQARTGTGKTLAFLIPVIQNIITYDPSLEKRKFKNPVDIRALIISPTRELAEQIAMEAKRAVKNTGIIVQTAVGGSSKNMDLRLMRKEGCHILVGTPGRLNDVLSDEYSGVRAPNLSALVLDEADRLLDMGFAPAIESIQKLLPDRRQIDRQTLLFSATVPKEVMHLINGIMKPDYRFVRTVQEGEQPTHEKVPQKIVQVAGFENLMPALVELCQRELDRKDAELPFKAIVYFNATAEARLAHEILENLKTPGSSQYERHPLYPASIIQIHSRLSQQQRTRAAEKFRNAKSSILLSSDVTARGMDFPNVTHVIQMMLPTDRDTYIHRIGRTARGDKGGEAWLFISPLEGREARTRLNKLPLQPDDSLATAKVDMTRDGSLAEPVAQILNKVRDATKAASSLDKSAAYRATLGAFSWFPQKQQLLDMMNNRTKYGWGLSVPPAISAFLARKLRIDRLVGLNIGTEESDEKVGNRRPGGFVKRSKFGEQSDRIGGGGPRQYTNDRRDRTSSSGYGRDRDSSSGYGRDRESSGFGRESRSSGFGRDRESSSGFGGRPRNDRSSGGQRGFQDRNRSSEGSGYGGRSFGSRTPREVRE